MFKNITFIGLCVLRANYNYGVAIAKFGSTAYFATNGLS